MSLGLISHKPQIVVKGRKKTEKQEVLFDIDGDKIEVGECFLPLKDE